MTFEDFEYSYIFYNGVDLKVKIEIGGLCQGKNLSIYGLKRKGNKLISKLDILDGKVVEFEEARDLNYKELNITKILGEDLGRANKYIFKVKKEKELDLKKEVFSLYRFTNENKEPNLETCGQTELMVYFYKKYLEKKGEYSKEKIYDFIDLEYSEKEEIFKNEVYQNLRTETKKEVILPVDKTLTVEQMGLLEATIYATFTIGKIIFR